MAIIVQRGEKNTSTLAVKRTITQSQPSDYVKSIVYGGLDGTITTFAIVSGVTGAALSPGIVLVLGIANLVADGISMAAGDFLSTRAEQDLEESARKKETSNSIEEEKSKLKQVYQDLGLTSVDSAKVVSIFAKKRELLTKVILREKNHFVASEESAGINAVVTFVSFVLFGFVPLIAYVLSGIMNVQLQNTFATATLLTAVTLFSLGALRAKLTAKPWHVAAAETLLIGGAAAAVAYCIGYLLSGFA